MAIFKQEKIKKMETPPLLHPPMVEAIFEIRWDLTQDQQSGRVRDPSYPMLYGRLYERLQKDFSFVEDLPANQNHPDATPWVPRHRLRKDRNSYPLLQVGPGIATVNFAKGYSWTDFRSLILRVIESIVELYPPGDFPLNFVRCELRYVNGVKIDLSRENPLEFLADKLHTKIELEKELYEVNTITPSPNSFGMNLSFPLQRPIGVLFYAVNLGQLEGKPALIQQTVVQSLGEMVPTERESFVPWLLEAHETAENTFQVFFKGTLMDKFCGS